MYERVKGKILSALVEYKLLKAALALLGASLVAAGFQGISIIGIPSGVLVAVGILTEVGLVYVVSMGIEKARLEIVDQRREINRMYREVSEISGEINQAKEDVGDVRRQVRQAESNISESQREADEASNTAQKAKDKIESMKRSIERGLQ